jgi:uncharacterized protein (DUF433 family)
MPIDWKEHIERRMSSGQAHQGTRIRSAHLGYLAAGQTADEIIREFPDLTKQHIAACLDYARELAEFEVVAS